jgi:hypothetical protein
VLVKESRAGTCEVRICPHVKGSIIINDAAGCHKENLSQWRGHLVVGKNVTVRAYGFKQIATAFNKRLATASISTT